jgi:divalent metal cation (Fe/Co/Zn/Cd) transporter
VDSITNTIIGFIGNEWVAIMQIRGGQQIGLDAMIADNILAQKISTRSDNP